MSEIEEISRVSPKEKYGLSHKDVFGTLEKKGQPFEVEWVKLPLGKTNFPCHAHHVSWEFYMVVDGTGVVRRNEVEGLMAAVSFPVQEAFSSEVLVLQKKM